MWAHLQFRRIGQMADGDHMPAQQHLERGDYLLQSAAMVADAHDLHIWRQKRDRWINATAASLVDEVGAGASTEFRAVASLRSPFAEWSTALVVEERALLAGLEALRSRQLLTE